MKTFTSTAYTTSEEMIFGKALQPVNCGFDIHIGQGKVLPEVNYTLPPMTVALDSVKKIRQEYEEMVTGILSRMVELKAPGDILEFEQTPQMSAIPEIGVAVTQLTRKLMQKYYDKHGLRSALRVTICDIREQGHPPLIRSGDNAAIMFDAFAENARHGANMLSIESIGGKEVSNKSLVEGDVTGVPISMEGKSAACAHFSHLGHITSAVCNMWSNESVQNIKLLSGFAPKVFAEILEYDCRLMNTALDQGSERILQKLLVDSDEYKSVHALMISPTSSFRLAQAIVAETDDFRRTHRAGVVACQIIRDAIEQQRLSKRIETQLNDYSTEAQVLEYGMTNYYKEAFVPQEYGL